MAVPQYCCAEMRRDVPRCAEIRTSMSATLAAGARSISFKSALNELPCATTSTSLPSRRSAAISSRHTAAHLPYKEGGVDLPYKEGGIDLPYKEGGANRPR